MRKQSVIVKIESVKKAKLAKAALKSLCEPIWHNFNEIQKGFLTFNDEDKWTIIDRSKDNWVRHLDKKNEISLRDLVIIIAGDKVDEKPSILTGKCAIAVNNEREFKLLMEHYEAKGWKSYLSGEVTEDYKFSKNYRNYDYHDNYRRGTYEATINDGYKIIPFADFAKEVGVEVPVFVMTSEDGVDLYKCDPLFMIRATCGGLNHKKWNLPLQKVLSNDVIKSLKADPELLKAFSTKEAAEAWIKEQNKLKHVTIALYRHKEYKSAEITPDKITIRDGNDIFFLKPSDLEDMLHAYKSLQQ